jgi:hypothetical protein
MPALPLSPRKAAALALGVASKGMELGAFAAKLAAQRLGQPQTGPDGGRPRGDEAPADPVPMVDPHARTYETHAAELADKPAAQLIRAIRDLSTDELRSLYEHEQANKKRKSVLREIENQLAPVG